MASLACSLVIFIFLLLSFLFFSVYILFSWLPSFFFFCLEGGNVGMCSDIMYVRCMRGMLRASSGVRTKSNGRLNFLSKHELYIQ